MSNGKKFEEDFRKSAELFSSVDMNRVPDPIGGRAGVRNICDFISYMYPHIYYLELKSRQDNTLSFKDITPNQWSGLILKMNHKGTIPGILVNYSDHSEAYFVHISDAVHLRDTQGKKSLHINDARQVGVQLTGTIRRTRYEYNVEKFLREVAEQFGSH